MESETLEETAARGGPLQAAGDADKPSSVRDLWTAAGERAVLNERQSGGEHEGENWGI